MDSQRSASRKRLFVAHTQRLVAILALAIAISGCGSDPDTISANGFTEQQPTALPSTEDVETTQQSTAPLRPDPTPAQADEQAQPLESNDDAAVGSLRYQHDSDTRVWASRIAVVDGENTYEMPDEPIIRTGGDAVRGHVTVEMQWEADDGADISVHFYTTHDGEQWWSYEVRTMVRREDGGDWVYYPGDNDTFFHGRESGTYFTSPLGTAYEGQLDLETLIVDDLRFEAFGFEFPVDPSGDLGDRPARNPVLEQTTPYRFETDYALIDAESVHFIIDGERVVPEGELDVSAPRSYVGEPRGYQEIEIRWEGEEGQPNYHLMIYFRSDGSQWWIPRVRATRDDDRVNIEGLALAPTPLGEVFVGDLIIDNLVMTDVRIELVGCTDEPGLRFQGRCPLDD